MVRLTCWLVIVAMLPVALRADDSDSTLRFYLSKADLVIDCEVFNDPAGFVTESGVTNYTCQIGVFSVLQGATNEEKLTVNVVRFDGTGGIPKKSGRYILFLNGAKTADFWFGIMDYRKRTAAALQRVAKTMRDEARWEPLRSLRGMANENIPKLIAIADSKDKEVALAAMSRLSNYTRKPEIVVFLRRKMKDADPQLALQAAIISCYSGDWSGFDMLLAHVEHKEPALRKMAIAQLGDSQFHRHADQIITALLGRLRVESDAAILERTIESLGNHRATKAVTLLQRFLTHEDERVRRRTKLAIDAIKAEKSRKQQ